MVNDERNLAEDTFNKLKKIEERVDLLEKNITALADKLNEIISVLNERSE